MDEIDDINQIGARNTLCALFFEFDELADPAILRERWRVRDRWKCYDELAPFLFDDLHLRERTEVEPGYLGLYSGLGRDLKDVADAFDRFDEWWIATGPHESDLDIIDSDLWAPVMSSIRVVLDRTESWRLANCERLPLVPPVKLAPADGTHRETFS